MDKNVEHIKKENICVDFQDSISDVLIRHKSILDIMTKMNSYNARINRAVVKAVTSCGCISIDAKKQDFIGESYKDLADTLDSHLRGEMCEGCKEVVDLEMGNYLFYITALCDTIGLNLNEVIEHEYDRNKTLGLFNLK
nr:DUF1573 domain-containing protein [Tissierella sp.]